MKDLEETSWHSYPKIYALGHRAIKTLFDEPVVIEEKIDGSQFSFGKIDGELRCRSKGKEIDLDAPEKMFTAAVETALACIPELAEGYTYRAEYLQKPKHNSLAYDRVPDSHLMIFDINDAHESYLYPHEKRLEASRIGLECVPAIWVGDISDSSTIKGFLERESVLGGQLIEGVVVKSYTQFGPDKKALMGKYVSERFKEIHQKEWSKSNPTGRDIIAELVMDHRTDARWDKAVQHLLERGELTHSPKDIGKLIAEIQRDVKDECEETIKERLFAWAWPTIERRVIKGFPERYKETLLESAFDPQAATEVE